MGFRRNNVRIDKLLANMGFGTRKEVRQLLKNGAVRVNEEVIKKPNIHVDPDQDQIVCLGEPVVYREFIYLMMNKKQGFFPQQKICEKKR